MKFLAGGGQILAADCVKKKSTGTLTVSSVGDPGRYIMQIGILFFTVMRFCIQILLNL